MFTNKNSKSIPAGIRIEDTSVALKNKPSYQTPTLNIGETKKLVSKTTTQNIWDDDEYVPDKKKINAKESTIVKTTISAKKPISLKTIDDSNLDSILKANPFSFTPSTEQFNLFLKKSSEEAVDDIIGDLTDAVECSSVTNYVSVTF